MTEIADVAVIGGGISGVSLAARLAPHARVVVLEAEPQLGTQSTARSAALFVESYGPPEMRRLTSMGRKFFEAPPEGFSDAPLARRRGVLIYGREEEHDLVREEFGLALQTAPVVWLGGKALAALCPLLRPGIASVGYLEPGALDLDAHALLHGFAREARRHGATILTDARPHAIERGRGGWRIAAAGREFACGIVVNAAGAWADRVAERADAAPRRLQPMRRTAATIGVPRELAGLLPHHPFVGPVDSSFYFKPETGAIMVSLSEETPSEPCDAYPDDLDVALALDRFHAATIVPPARPTAAWAGLRTFAPDRLPVLGFDPEAEGFFWYAGQGGTGIQTAPAHSALAAKLILGDPLEPAETEIVAAFSAARPMLP